MENLINILSTRRQHNSEGESAFIERYIKPLNPAPYYNEKGEVLTYVVDNTHGHSKVMWSCHIDTMHRDTGTSCALTQEVWVAEDGIAFVTDKDDCLGADDGAGMWLMLEMIKANVAGTYVFHRGEEIGCWGSSGMAKIYPDWLAQFTHAIAFDRRGTTSIITHQRGERACSDTVGTELLMLFNMMHELDPTGVYTDTAEYMQIIPECVNISIGYESEHCSMETCDTKYVIALRDAICALDWDKVSLSVVRDPTVVEYRDNYGYGYGYGYGAYKSKGITKTKPLLDAYDYPDADVIGSMTTSDLAEWVMVADPMDVAYLLQDLADQIAEASYANAYGNELDKLDVGMR